MTVEELIEEIEKIVNKKWGYKSELEAALYAVRVLVNLYKKDLMMIEGQKGFVDGFDHAVTVIKSLEEQGLGIKPIVDVLKVMVRGMQISSGGVTTEKEVEKKIEGSAMTTTEKKEDFAVTDRKEKDKHSWRGKK